MAHLFMARGVAEVSGNALVLTFPRLTGHPISIASYLCIYSDFGFSLHRFSHSLASRSMQ